MSTNAGTFGRFQLFLYGVLEFFASKMCSKHGKRVLFISSLYVQVTQLERMKAEVVSKLNMVMGFKITREDSVHLPAAVSGIVWRGTNVSEVLTKELLNQPVNDQQVRDIATRVVDLCPRWIRYAAKNVMEQDVADLIMNGRVLQAA
jgi:hypothetical protein